jgi:UDP-N-acetylmuramoyl-tripeptide--D-alanyl-D-alanine ligase
MDPLTLGQIAEFCGGALVQGDGTAQVSRLSTDSRTLRAGDLFVALRGDNFDGHEFVERAANAGAAGAIIEQSWSGNTSPNFALIRVDDALAAYQSIAANYRASLPLKVIAITGSNGKTSTKDFVASVLSRAFRVTKTDGNFNNHIGLPKTILDATSADEIGVWEIGMNHPGEIAPLARIAAPDAAIITNIGVAHIEFMGSREAIAQEKGDLAAAVPASGTVILSGDDLFSDRIAQRTSAKIIIAGIERGAVHAIDIRQSANGAEFTLLEGAHHSHAVLPVPGSHMVQNALLAVAAGRAFGIPLEECAAGLATAPITQARLQIKTIGGLQFIDDSYNANPDSMKAALRTLVDMEEGGRRVAILGQMSELGAESASGHREVGETAARLEIDQLIVLGKGASEIAESAREAGLEASIAAESPEEAAELLCETARPGDLVLVKGSRSARMERVLEEYAKRRMEAGCAS